MGDEDSGNPLMELFAEMARKTGIDSDAAEGEDAEDVALDIEAIRLREAFASFQTTHNFVPGMIVRQKPQAKGYRNAGKHDLGIVVEVLTTPVLLDDVEHSAGSPYFRKPLDLIIGHRSANGFAVFYVDSRHYEPVAEAELKLRVKGSRAKQ